MKRVKNSARQSCNQASAELHSISMLKLPALAAVMLVSVPQSALACATCYGASDSDLARGMNWGILSLLFVVIVVLSGIGSFFVYVAKRSAAVGASRPLADGPTSVEADAELLDTLK